MQTLGEAATKLILFGEHAALYGSPAVGIELPWKLKVTLNPSNKLEWETGLEYRHQEKLNQLLKELPRVFPELNDIPPIKIHLHSEMPIGVGLGSSGALSVALTKCLLSHLNRQENLRKIWSLAHELEKTFHSTPSGIDTGLSTFGGCGVFERSTDDLPSFRALTIPPPFIVMGALPRKSDTKSLVQGLKDKLEKNPPLLQHIVSLKAIAKQAIKHLENDKELGTLATQAHSELSALGLSTSSLDAMIKHGLAHGATGGKLSGAGGGGAYFLITKDQISANHLAKELDRFAKQENISHAIYPCPLTQN